MKKLLYIALLLPLLAIGQSQNQNYVKTTTYQQPFDATNIPANPTPEQAAIQVGYVDGLGRPIQSVQSRAGGNKEDIILPVAYDAYGRQLRDYLPYTESSNTTALYRDHALQDVLTYYQNRFAGTTNPYSEKLIDQSPMDRTFEQAAPGTSWKLDVVPFNQISLNRPQVAPHSKDANAFINLNQNNTLSVHIRVNPTTDNLTYFNTSYSTPLPLPFSLTSVYLGNITYMNGAPTDFYGEITNNVFRIRASQNNPNPITQVIDMALSVDVSTLLGTAHTIKYDYQTNDVAEVIKFGVGFEGSNTEITNLLYQNYHPAGTLYKTITRDENWQPADGLNKTTEEFKDKNGRILLKRTYNDSDPHDTYYVYDRFGNLTYVIPPSASSNIVKIWREVVPAGVNRPWSRLVLADADLATKYERLLADYDNSQILNLDLMDEFGGMGGYSLLTEDSGKVSLSINFALTSPAELKTGIIEDLKGLGMFANRELGRISGPDYEYTFTVDQNAIKVDGHGKVPGINVVLDGENRLEYTRPFDWAVLANIPANEADQYAADAQSISPVVRLSTYTANPHGATGGLLLTISDDDTVTASLNISAQQPMSLKTGTVASLGLYRRLDDRVLGTVTDSAYSYTFEIRDNSILVTGSGNFTHLSLGSISTARPPSVTLDETVVDGLCYIYHYDRRNRVVEKHIPDKGWEHLVYDRLERVVVSQDEKLRQQHDWLFTKYDIMGRVAYTGLWTNPETLQRRDVQANLDQYGLALYESRTIENFFNFDSQGAKVFYTNKVFPSLDTQVYTANYYDDYEFDYTGLTLPVTNDFNTALATNDSPQTLKGLPTGSLVRTLGTNQWSVSLTGYDAKGRAVWGGLRNDFLAFTHYSHTEVDFTGKAMQTKSTQLKDNEAALEIRDNFTYDHAGRVLKQVKSVNENEPELIVFNKYDDLGQLAEKKVGKAYNPSLTYANTNALQREAFSYNIRGWLTGINDITHLGTSLFAFAIAYDQPENAAPLFNGNIAETRWMTGDEILRGYRYSYDALNRLNMAHWTGGTALADNPNAQEDYSEGPIAYDKNGNILELQRFGMRTNEPNIDKIDILTYSYLPSSNRLVKVTDAAGTDGFSNGTSADDEDYKYDVNGNMTTDRNKNIRSISYNHLNLPTLVQFRNGGSISFIYDATGAKIRKTVTQRVFENDVTTVTDYAGGFIYINDILQHFGHAEGYVSYDAPTNKFKYIYQYKDHLGNSRVSFTDGTSGPIVVEENHYYAFGLKHKGYGTATTGLGNAHAEQYKYQGQERQEELGLGWDSFKWRNYDYAIGRFFNVDPLAEKYQYNSVYAFAENKLGMGRELEGLEMTSERSKDGKSITVTMKVKPVNTLPTLRESDFARLISARKSLTEKTLSGKTQEGQNVKANVVLDNDATIIWEYNGQIDRDGGEVTPVWGDALALGYTSENGNTQNNRTQVNVLSEFGMDETGSYVNVPTDTKRLSNVSRTGTHEDGHVTGQEHPNRIRDKKIKSEVYLNILRNIMNTEGSGTEMTPGQRSTMIKNIEDQQPQ